MAEVGDILRRSREQQGISIGEAEQATRIRQKYLEGLEADDYSVMPASVYTRGFLRSYASFLQLDVESLLDDYDHVERAAVLAPRVRTSKRPTQSVHAWRGPDMRMSVIAVLLIVVAGGLAYFFRQYSEFVASSHAVGAVSTPRAGTNAPLPTIAFVPTTSPPLAAIPLATSTSVPALPTAVTVTAPPTATLVPPAGTAPLPTPSPPPAPTATPISGVAITTTLSEPSWMRVIVDGATTYEGILQAGSSRQWDGKRTVLIRVGNAGGVRMSVNGKDVGVLGSSGQVFEKTYRAEPSATPKATLAQAG